MSLLKVSNYVIEDLEKFISERDKDSFPNSFLIAQAFILKYPDHGRNYSIFQINDIIEDML